MASPASSGASFVERDTITEMLGSGYSTKTSTTTAAIADAADSIGSSSSKESATLW